MAPCAPLTYYHLKRRHSIASPLYSNTNQQLLKRTSSIKVATMKITDDFCLKLKPLHAYHKIDTFPGEQRLMEHKRGQNHEECIVCTVVWQKAPLRLSDIE